MKRTPELYAVTGKPVAHSLSPEIFKRLFRSMGRDAVYMRLAADSAAEALETAREIGMSGLNVTSPFKETFLTCLDGMDHHASKIGAVNCIGLDGRLGAFPGGRSLGVRSRGGSDSFQRRRDGSARALGHNTDFLGLLGALNTQGFSPAGRTALVLGTGGAARAAAYGLKKQRAARVILAGRSAEKTCMAARALGCDGMSLGDAEKTIGRVDLCVSCLPFPLSQILGVAPPDTVLMVDAHYAGAPAGPNDGVRRASAALSWLFHQAVPSFEIFTGLEVPKDIKKEAWQEFSRREKRRKPHVAFIGFMGAGKTTVGRIFAELTGSEFYDTDEMIEAAAGVPAARIFESRGEATFRALEKPVIEKLATAEGGPRKVIAVGGGAVLDKDNCRVLAGACHIIWLWAPAAAAVARIDAATRPVLDRDRPLASARRILAARLPLYAAASDLVIGAAARIPREIAGRVKDELDQAFKN